MNDGIERQQFRVRWWIAVQQCFAQVDDSQPDACRMQGETITGENQLGASAADVDDETKVSSPDGSENTGEGQSCFLGTAEHRYYNAGQLRYPAAEVSAITGLAYHTGGNGVDPGSRVCIDEMRECVKRIQGSPAGRFAEHAAGMESLSQAGNEVFAAERNHPAVRLDVCYQQADGIGSNID